MRLPRRLLPPRRQPRQLLEDRALDVESRILQLDVHVVAAEELLERLKDGPVDSVLLDVRLPGMDGLSALEKVRQEYPETNVIMISGHATLNDAVRATKLGAFDFLEKPLNRERVLVSSAT